MPMIVEAPWPLESQAHLSPVSSPEASSQPLPACGSVSVSAYSCPPTIVMPSFEPLTPLLADTKFAPQPLPASVMYGKFVYGTSAPLELLVTSCQAQYCVLKPEGTTPCGESTMIWMLSPATPK